MFKNNKELIGLSLSAFLLMLGDGMVLALLPQKVIDLTNSISLIGYLASTYAIAQLISQIPIGVLADRMGVKFFIITGYVLSVLSGLLYYFTTNVNLVFLGRVLQGIGEAPILALAPALLSLQYPSSKGKKIGIYNASIYLGLTMGPLVGMVFFEKWSDNQIFLFYAVMCLLGTIINSYILENRVKCETTNNENINLSNLIVFIKNPYTLVILFGITLYGSGFGMFLTIIPAFLITEKSFGQSYIGIFFSMFYVAISLAQIITGFLSDKMGRKIFMVIGLIIAAVGLRMTSNFDHMWLNLVFCVTSLGLGIFYLSSLAYLNETVPDYFKGTISGAYYLFWGIGMFWGPLIFSNYLHSSKYYFGFSIFALLLALEAVLLFMTTLIQSRTTGYAKQMPR